MTDVDRELTRLADHFDQNGVLDFNDPRTLKVARAVLEAAWDNLRGRALQVVDREERVKAATASVVDRDAAVRVLTEPWDSVNNRPDRLAHNARGPIMSSRDVAEDAIDRLLASGVLTDAAQHRARALLDADEAWTRSESIAQVRVDARREVAEETLHRVLHDLDGTVVKVDDVDGNAGTYMQAVHGGDTDRGEDWNAAYTFARDLAAREAHAEVEEAGDE